MAIRVTILYVAVGVSVHFGVAIWNFGIVVVVGSVSHGDLGWGVSRLRLVASDVEVHEQDDEDGRVEDETSSDDPVEGKEICKKTDVNSKILINVDNITTSVED